MRPALALVLLFAAAPVWAQLPADGQTSYSRDDRIRIPFELRTGGKATRVVLYYSLDGGPWQEYESARQGQKKEFIFKADRDGTYSFATMTYFADGTSDPARKDELAEQRRVVIDKTPPKIVSVRPIVSADGSPGIEWDVTDEYPDPRGVKLEFRWDGMGRYEPIDRNVPFELRGSRHWQVKANERMQVRVVALDRAGNRAESDPVWVAGRDADRGGAGDPLPPRAPATTGTSSGSLRDTAVAPAAGRRAAQPSLHYVNDKTITLNVNATAGPSGLTKTTLWVADDKLEWKVAKENGPAKPVAGGDPDRPRPIPVTFEYKAPGDGVYSFVIVLTNHRGQNRPDPRKGDAGDVQVVVDTTAPDVKLTTEPRVSANGDRAAVDLRWEAKDKNIHSLPIKLEYQAAGGESSGWKQIADWMDNSGQYTWTAPTGEGYEFRIRVTCRDRAGNESSAVTANPVNVDLARPGVQGVDVAPGKTGPAPSTGMGAGGGFGEVPLINVTGGSRKGN